MCEEGAARALTRATARDHGPDGIRDNAICPGDIDTPMPRGFLAGDPGRDALQGSGGSLRRAGRHDRRNAESASGIARALAPGGAGARGGRQSAPEVVDYAKDQRSNQRCPSLSQ
ncbi:MAG: SDR family oxidoreductase [Paracoccaceae bacterium]|nr:SDR family oxidoreductase [Paracoccaceae bacterium]